MLEQIFLLMTYCGFNYSDAYRLPIQYRMFFIRRINEEMKKQRESNDGETLSRPSYENNNHELRSMNGMPGRRKF